MGRRLGKMWMRVRWAVRQRGIRGAVRMALGRLRRGGRGQRVMVHPFDVEHGVETSGLIEGAELPGGHPHDVSSTAYFGVPPSRMRRLLKEWRETEGVGRVEEYAFLDVGCGKGRALLLASELPFREVVGVELNRELSEVAERNVERWRTLGLARSPVRVVCGDATEVQVARGPLLLYLYNPFRAEVLRVLLERLEVWAGGEGAGKMEVLYLYPEEEGVFAEFPRFRRLWTRQIGLAEEDAGVDEISAAEDPCSAYRWVG